MEPTKEQIKEFWERCGAEEKHLYDSTIEPRIYWAYPDDTMHLNPPDIDLNNLFKYAVPRLQDKGYMIELYSYEQKGYKVSVYCITGQVDIPIAITTDGDPALALFWALWQVKEKDGKSY